MVRKRHVVLAMPAGTNRRFQTTTTRLEEEQIPYLTTRNDKRDQEVRRMLGQFDSTDRITLFAFPPDELFRCGHAEIGLLIAKAQHTGEKIVLVVEQLYEDLPHLRPGLIDWARTDRRRIMADSKEIVELQHRAGVQVLFVVATIGEAVAKVIELAKCTG